MQLLFKQNDLEFKLEFIDNDLFFGRTKLNFKKSKNLSIIIENLIDMQDFLLLSESEKLDILKSIPTEKFNIIDDLIDVLIENLSIKNKHKVKALLYAAERSEIIEEELGNNISKIIAIILTNINGIYFDFLVTNPAYTLGSIFNLEMVVYTEDELIEQAKKFLRDKFIISFEKGFNEFYINIFDNQLKDLFDFNVIKPFLFKKFHITGAGLTNFEKTFNYLVKIGKIMYKSDFYKELIEILKQNDLLPPYNEIINKYIFDSTEAESYLAWNMSFHKETIHVKVNSYMNSSIDKEFFVAFQIY